MKLVPPGAEIADQLRDVEEVDLAHRHCAELVENSPEAADQIVYLRTVLAVHTQVQWSALTEHRTQTLRVRVGRVVAQLRILRERMHDIDTKSVDPPSEPKPQYVVHRFYDRRVGPVQVRLLG